MNQPDTEKNIAPNNIPEGEFRHNEAHGSPEKDLVKERPEKEMENIPRTQPEKEAPARFTLPKLKKKKVIAPVVRDQMTKQIEKTLSLGLEDVYRSLSPIAQQEFKIKGEATASKIRDLMRSARVKAKKIFHLILEWLSLLPSVNRFFLEQEAKIKTDKIMALKNQEKNYN